MFDWLASRPRRPPNLGRICGKAAVRECRALAARWVDQQYQLIESAVPWLDRVGTAVDDRCQAGRAIHGWVIWESNPWRFGAYGV